MSLIKRFYQYQAERFPLLGYLPMIATFTFSAAAFSRMAAGDEGFIPMSRFLPGCLTALTFFFMLRVLDEHKDQDLDQRWRPELPVPRGLISLRELRWIGGGLLALCVVLNFWVEPKLVIAMAVAAVWAALMTKEFFAPQWLRAHPTAYLVSHMMIMPMIDVYSTGLDWICEGRHPGSPLVWFLVVTFLNGCVIEIGRKIRVPQTEREGVDTYTKVWGMRRAVVIWLLVLAATAGCAWVAGQSTGAAWGSGLVLAVMFVVCAVPGVAFLRGPSAAWSKRVETLSGVWTLAMYLWLGAGPWTLRWFGIG